ncbi:NAD(P)H-hydrate dehydratase [Salinicola aestuarinus]|uniref:NAD(P)H-hydrate dehydratase n=1 Tax=Salinicola aestuarinus TaxID=1949082 RepID=UPI000DA2043F|nr:NAD(P)H-hydrate dehydratase [Salinicola aestuarinus]
MSASSQQRPLYLAEQVRELDRRAIADERDDFALMQRAGEAAYETLRSRWPTRERLSVLCGGGNNGGDGYVVATLAAAEGLAVQLIAVTPVGQLTGSARHAAILAQEAGVVVVPWASSLTLEGDVLVDALLGTGTQGAPRAPFDTAIACMNATARPAMAIDVPSGVDADTGFVAGEAVRASVTVTFIADKLGLHTGAALDHVGDIVYLSLGVSPAAHTDMVPVAWRQSRHDIAEGLPPRSPCSHKGSHGHVLVVAGGPGMGGAALMTSEMVARLGAGKVSLATDPAHVTASLTRYPEIMAHGVRGTADLAARVEAADVIAVGPGLGTGAWGQAALASALAAGKPCVVDADGLNLLASEFTGERRNDWILTPHPGEAGRLLGCTTAEVQRDRRAAITALQARFGGVVVLKGAGTLIFDGETLALCPFGNPGMASGGMGDALTGIIAGLVGQTESLSQAARLGVVIHALAADAAAEAGGVRGLLASDLASYARHLANPH